MVQPEGDLRAIVIDSVEHASAAKRRLWKARDEVTRLQTLLAAATAAVAVAERDYEESRGVLSESWDFLKTELMAPKSTIANAADGTSLARSSSGE